jgi:uncharacterized protein
MKGYGIYYSKNKEAIARSSEGYENSRDCEHSFHLMQYSKNDKIYYATD